MYDCWTLDKTSLSTCHLFLPWMAIEFITAASLSSETLLTILEMITEHRDESSHDDDT